MEKNYFKFIESVKTYIAQHGITVTAFAKLIDCRERCVARWINETNIPSTEYVIKVADKLNVSVDYLFELKESPEFVPADSRSSIAERIQLLLKETKINKRQLALQWKIEPSTFSKWIYGTRIPKPDMIYKIAEYFVCSIDYLLGRTDLR